MTTTCTSSATNKVQTNSLKCTFKVYNGKNLNSKNDSAKTFTTDCNENTWTDNGVAKYLNTIGKDRWSLQHAFGKYSLLMNAAVVDNVYGEYKIVLDEVNYKYCDGDNRQTGTPIKRVCDVNFAVTKPYLVQKSSFGLTPKATDINLDNFYDLEGKSLISNTDLDQIMVLDDSTYA